MFFVHLSTSFLHILSPPKSSQCPVLVPADFFHTLLRSLLHLFKCDTFKVTYYTNNIFHHIPCLWNHQIKCYFFNVGGNSYRLSNCSENDLHVYVHKDVSAYMKQTNRLMDSCLDLGDNITSTTLDDAEKGQKYPPRLICGDFNNVTYIVHTQKNTKKYYSKIFQFLRYD